MKPTQITVKVPKEFDFQECLNFLNRNEKECLHFIRDDKFVKPLLVEDQPFLLEIFFEENLLKVDIFNGVPDKKQMAEIRLFISEQFDLQADLSGFYEKVEGNEILDNLIKKHFGLRLLGMPDLFECLIWSIIGQQINLNFAYILKEKLVKTYGESFDFNGKKYWLLPTPKTISKLTIEELRAISFSKQKANYIIGIAKLFEKEELNKEKLQKLSDLESIKKELIKIKGIGNWTANYVAMKCLLVKSAFPIEDVGIHNAIKFKLNWERKPTIPEVRKFAENWKGWEAYATFYLWRSLIS